MGGNTSSLLQRTAILVVAVAVAQLQGGEDSSDALCCSLFSAKDPLIIGIFAENDL